MARLIVLDASVLIAHLDARDAHHEEAEKLLGEAGSTELGASVITLAEVLVAPARRGRLEDAEAAIERLGVIAIAPTGNSAARLASLRAEVGLKLPDCCVLDAAEQNDAKVATFDHALSSAAQKMGLAH